MEDEESKSSQVKDVAEAVAAVAKAVPIYEDAIQPGAKQIGKSLELVGKTVNVALAPLRAIVWGYEQFEVFLNKDVAEKLKNTPEESIITPKINVAGPLLEALRYSAEEQGLREMFANLLANAMDKNTSSTAHPSFVEILKQLTPDEAKLMKYFAKKGIIPKLNFYSRSGTTKENFLSHRNFTLAGYEADCSFPHLINTYLDNLSRLGLLEIFDDIRVRIYDDYIPLLESKQWTDWEKQAENAKRIVEPRRGSIRTSEFGELFCKACVIDKASQSPSTVP
ncbi:DUF4393 domain-containing protein [Sneathiella chungangensis]|uniref:DUF4393 domain-containing protein n=1 Tax=Sneathiella chungangensis TaxID=1418234 RepID=A0A845MER1_9PROT|nr:DUF4393 domain-containing protein [Sneathiella chungangensis]MZR21524.1 DUF4393 domain-containing protein [Sneathiella chungangensis]